MSGPWIAIKHSGLISYIFASFLTCQISGAPVQQNGIIAKTLKLSHRLLMEVHTFMVEMPNEELWTIKSWLFCSIRCKHRKTKISPYVLSCGKMLRSISYDMPRFVEKSSPWKIVIPFCCRPN
ncbi:hypothetical protein GQ55_1G046500 [Panicum hallii var. hallii]|uniref:Secreted protein n=1 Tax=Panicum hallii var. hallii TaxID=1504633 RepID=A0A2T7F2A7_9POAL|nr:hypothetical protein GQ55_1G046500 [Panicum hallii var. hallii]